VGAAAPARCNLQLDVVPNDTYEIQISTNLPAGWSSLAVITPTNAPVFFVDTNSAANPRFYRLHGL